jgi:hypothetical protein
MFNWPRFPLFSGRRPKSEGNGLDQGKFASWGDTGRANRLTSDFLHPVRQDSVLRDECQEAFGRTEGTL